MKLLPIGTLDQFYREHRQELFTCALAVTRCADRAEDAIQEAFFRLCRLDVRPENLKAYVFRSVRNASLDQLRGNSYSTEMVPEFIFDPRPGPSETAAGQEFQQRVSAALMALSADERETIVQRLYGSLTFRDIAEIREAPLGTVTSWYQRGLDKLRTELGRSP